MSGFLTIPQIIAIGDVSIYLSAINNAKGQLYGNRLANPVSPLLISISTDALRWEYEGNPTNTTLRGTADYLLWQCGGYGLQAQYIISGSGGGTVIPPISLKPRPLDFVVSSTSPVATGQSGLTIPSFIGYNLIFSRGGIEQSTVDVGGGASYYGWNRDTGTFSCSPAAFEDEQFVLTPV